MVDFGKLVKKDRNVDVTDIGALFESLDRQTSHIELRPVQSEAIKLLTKRRSDPNLILKISTGAGKTTVGLLYLLSFMEELKQPVVYLCPTNQLADQVHDEAQKLGIHSVLYPGGQTYPHVDGIGGKAIIICTYDKLFNAKTTFDRADVRLRPTAIVLDDAHAGVEEIRNAFTLRVSGNELHRELLSILNDSCHSFNSAIWRGILDHDPNRSLEVPFWIWKSLLTHIDEAITSFAKKGDEIQFVWPYLQNLLRWCRCVVAGDGLEIIPDILPVHKSAAFNDAKHRLFMSATLADDSVLVREIGCSIDAAKAPILPVNDKGFGERMVIAPTLVNEKLDRSWIMQTCNTIAEGKSLRIVVLSPSEKKARDWEPFGAKVVLGDHVPEAIKELRNPASELRFVAFIQRYDGLDLPDKSCRILVIDGLPYGEGIVDRYDSSLTDVAGGTRNRLIYRIEQGMGRAVRSYADYAVIILSGAELAHFIARHDVLSAMNPDTAAQLRLAIDLAKIAMEEGGAAPGKAVIKMMSQCIKRDEDWKQYYNENIRKIDKSQSDKMKIERLEMADAERRAFRFALANEPQTAVDLLRKSMNDFCKSSDDRTIGWYLQRVANYMYELNPGEGLEIQRAAHEKNNTINCPPGVVKRPVSLKSYDSQAVMLKWLEQFENLNGAIASIEDLKTRLSYDVSPAIMEQAVLDLAPLLGAHGSRPEKEFGEGPDVLWLWSDVYFVIEAKNGNQEYLHKTDAEQLTYSIEWFKKIYKMYGEPVPIVIAKVAVSDNHVSFPLNTRVLLAEGMRNLLDNLQNLYRTLIAQPDKRADLKSIAKLQSDFTLLPNQLAKNYFVKATEAKK